MGVLRRLSQAFSGNGVPIHDYQEHNEGEQLNVYPSSSHNPYPQSAQFPNDRYHHARGPSDQYDNAADYGRDQYDDYNDDERRLSFDADEEYDRQSIAPSYLTSAAGQSAAALPGDDSDDEDEREGGDKYALMTAHLYQRAQSLGWFKSKKVLGMGVVSIRIKKNLFKCVSLPSGHFPLTSSLILDAGPAGRSPRPTSASAKARLSSSRSPPGTRPLRRSTLRLPSRSHPRLSTPSWPGCAFRPRRSLLLSPGERPN
jgi:hypothetical protein